jgi:hypothetical protein
VNVAAVCFVGKKIADFSRAPSQTPHFLENPDMHNFDTSTLSTRGFFGADILESFYRREVKTTHAIEWDKLIPDKNCRHGRQR